MIRLDKLRGWAETGGARVRPVLAVATTRMRAAVAAVQPAAKSAAAAVRGTAAASARQASALVRHAAATATPAVRQAAATANEHVRPLAAKVEPGLASTGSLLGRAARATLARVLPVLALCVNAIRRQVEAGRDARATPRELRDGKGRRLRASAYAYGPEGPRNPRRRPRGGPHVAGSLLPAGVKIGLVVLVAGGAFLGSSSVYINYAADLPDAHAITEKPLDEDTLIYSADGTLLADIHPQDQPEHYYESLDQMGKWLPQATISIEDQNFWSEPGVDVFAMGRAAWIDWRNKQPVQGASTITQQLVKLRLIGNKPTIDRKIKEAVLALQVEHTYTKRQILEQYLNAVDYSNNSRGSLAAARVYFHKDTKDLDLAQAAMLAGIPQSPLYNNPFSQWDQARRRQAEVLDAMVRNHMITQEQSDEAYAEDLSAPAHMFRAGRQIYAAPNFVDWTIGVLEAKYGTAATYGGGLRVQTTLNLQLQGIAQKSVVDQVNSVRNRYGVSQGAMTAIDPRTGAVLAMVGSADPAANGGQFNMAVYPPRSPGSSMKMYTYTAAIESRKYTMATMIPDTPVTITDQWGNSYSPKNYDRGYHGTLQLQQAMGNSLNVPAVKVEMTLGVDHVAEMARKMGAPPFYPHPQADGSTKYTTDDPVSVFTPSLTLGGYGETPLQMATGASVLGAQGMYHQPYGIESIQTSDGTEIFKVDSQKNAKRVLDQQVAYVMEQIMSNDQNRSIAFGRNSPLVLNGRTAGAKTGTSEIFTDAWTVGYTPSLASAFWFGNPNYAPMATNADGIFVAAPAWHSFMQTALDALKAPNNEWFAEPPGLGHATVGGEPVWLLPGTNQNQPMPALPAGTSSSGAPPDNHKPPTS
jgi:penicillin-binding protein 1A